ncbi:RagB/SusD family nutrient uptake outer membrane protein [Echinicola shivajiensis]|uniref:RagB/SusD family nutrient uptake outer membrane protein n=1 Tax=Echinicola shivajiensis TaxID=1035916 RepID=UPI001BFC2B1F|nr:RagB/SusD family nutrient uptake outer membrane protein [Echinicola shivajiensis]
MKNKIINGLSLAVLLFSVWACKEMDLNPHDQLAEGTFWKTESDAQLALTGIYDQLKTNEPWGSDNFLNSFSLPALDALTDNAYTQHNRLGAKNAMATALNSQTSGVVTGFYGIAYKQIGAVNYFLENVDNVEAAAQKINQWKGEALFFRGLMFYYLSEFYGDVPLVTSTYALGDDLLPRSSKSEVVAQAIEDLDFAIANLEEKAYDGRVGKTAAQAIKARVLMANQQWSAAAALTKEIMESGFFDLTPSFNSLFTAPEQEGNPEIIYSVRYLRPNEENFGSLNWGWWMSISPLANFVDDFEMKNGLPITDPASGYDPENPYANRDPRLSLTVDHPGSVFGFAGENGGEDIMWSDRIQYLPPPLMYNLRKYADRTFQASVDASNHCDTDYVVLRFAEVLLNYAEAQNEVVGPDASVYEAINKVRSRVEMPDIPSGLSQSEMRATIRHERRVELAFEGIRWLDLKRWGKLVERVSTIDETQVPVPYMISINNDLWPLPQSEVDFYSANGLELGQNPGY